jgi:hypothetical protein
MQRIAIAFLIGCNTTSTGSPPPAPTPTPTPTPAQSATASAAPTTSAAGARCTKDADCSLMSSYCSDLPCACLPYVTSAGAPKCNQPNAVKCLVDPCQRKSAACQDGKCVVTAAGSATQ